MNKIVSLIKPALVFVTLAVAVNASPVIVTDYIASYTGRTDTPVPVKVEVPSISPHYIGDTIKASFKVDADGKVNTVKIVSLVDEAVRNAIENALYKWEFKPLLKDGIAVASTVILPIKVVSN